MIVYVFLLFILSLTGLRWFIIRKTNKKKIFLNVVITVVQFVLAVACMFYLDNEQRIVWVIIAITIDNFYFRKLSDRNQRN